MCKYKEGDVGIRRLESFNMALLEKWRWLLGEKINIACGKIDGEEN